MSNSQGSPFFRFSVLLVLSIGLMIVDHKSQLIKPVRVVFSVLNIPVENIIRLPQTLSETLDQYYPDKSLHDDYQRLKQRQIVLEAKLQRFESIEKENERLAKLLSSSRRSSDEVILSEMVNFGVEPFNQTIIVNRGIESGVYLGQPAISPDGVLGQVSKAGYRSSVVTLITDASHGLPVQVQRNGLRTIVHGSGKADRILVPYLEAQADIRNGDLLVTSGIGGRFPMGYQVAIVTDVVKDANEAFLKITAETTAKIGFTKEVLLLWNTDYISNPRPPHLNEQENGTLE